MDGWVVNGYLIGRADNRWAAFVDGEMVKQFDCLSDAITWAKTNGAANDA